MISSSFKFEPDLLNTFFALQGLKLKILHRMCKVNSTFATAKFSVSEWQYPSIRKELKIMRSIIKFDNFHTAFKHVE